MQPSTQAQAFLSRLATDANLLLDFIKDPTGVLQDPTKFNIQDPDTIEFIRNTVAVEVAK